MECRHDITTLRTFGCTTVICKPIYRIPLHVSLGFCLSAWKDSRSSTLPLVVRRVTTGVALIALAILGLIDIVAWTVSALFMFVITQSTNAPKICLRNAYAGLILSARMLTSLQLTNITKENFVIYC